MGYFDALSMTLSKLIAKGKEPHMTTDTGESAEIRGTEIDMARARN